MTNYYDDADIPDHFTPEALIESAQHNLTDSRTKSQLFWAAATIERLQEHVVDLEQDCVGYRCEAERLQAAIDRVRAEADASDSAPYADYDGGYAAGLAHAALIFTEALADDR